MDKSIVFTLEFFKTLRTLFRVILGIIIVYFSTKFLTALADNNLIKLDVLANLFLKISGTIYISWTLTGASIILCCRYRSLMKKKVVELSPYKDMVEKAAWENKISSEINIDGTTLKEDKL